MAALPTNDQILDRYFQSDDDDSDFEGFSEVGSDVDNALDSSEDEQGDDSESENDDEIWTDWFRDVEVHDFTERTGPVFPDGFNVETASPKDCFDLMFNPDMIGNMVRNTNKNGPERRGGSIMVWNYWERRLLQNMWCSPVQGWMPLHLS